MDMPSRRAQILRALRFGLVGASGMIVDLSIYAILLPLGPAAVSRALAIWCAMTWNFALNRRLTFAVRRETPIIRQYIAFCLACLLGASISWSVAIGLQTWSPFFAERPLLGAALGILAGTGCNYAFCCLVVFRTSPEGDVTPADLAQTIAKPQPTRQLGA